VPRLFRWAGVLSFSSALPVVSGQSLEVCFIASPLTEGLTDVRLRIPLSFVFSFSPFLFLSTNTRPSSKASKVHHDDVFNI
jgi:hypothetical protein